MSHPQARARLRAPCLERVAPGGVHIRGHRQQCPGQGPQHPRVRHGGVVTSPGTSRSGVTSLLTGARCDIRWLLLRRKNTTRPQRLCRLAATALRMAGDGVTGARRLMMNTPNAPLATTTPMRGVTLRMPGEIPRGARRPVCFLRLAG